MPKYTVKPEKNSPETAMPSSPKKDRYPTVTVQVSPEIIDALEIDQAAEVILRGKIVGLMSNKGEGYPGDRDEIRIELREVEAYPDEEGAEEEEPEETMAGAIDKALGYGKKDE